MAKKITEFFLPKPKTSQPQRAKIARTDDSDEFLGAAEPGPEDADAELLAIISSSSESSESGDGEEKEEEQAEQRQSGSTQGGG